MKNTNFAKRNNSPKQPHSPTQEYYLIATANAYTFSTLEKTAEKKRIKKEYRHIILEVKK